MKHLILQTPEFESLYNEFKEFVRIKGYSPKKKEALFPSNVKEFLHFLENRNKFDIRIVNALDMIEYYEYLRERPNYRRAGGLSDSMIKHNLATIGLFFDYLLDIEFISSSPARLPRFVIGKAKHRNHATVDEIEKIYATCETKRDQALLSIAYGCGLRRDEIFQLNINDVSLHKGILIVKDGKGGKSRTIPISNSVLKHLKEYVIDERPSYCMGLTVNAFFVKKGKRMTGQALNLRFKTLLIKTNDAELILKDLTLHCLRHSIATHLLDKGANIEFVQTFLGHSDINASHIYARKRKQQTAILKAFTR